VPAGLRESLAAAHAALGGRLAIVSGRAPTELDRILAPLRLPAAAEHGAWLRRDGNDPWDATPLPAVPAAWRAHVMAAAEGHPGVIVEVKPVGLTVHLRQAPDALPRFRALLAELVARAPDRFVLTDARWRSSLPAQGRQGWRCCVLEPRAVPGRCPCSSATATDENGFAVARRLSGSACAWLAVCAPDRVRRWLDHRPDWPRASVARPTSILP
jgi:trehalose 6-phosphate phosphatase